MSEHEPDSWTLGLLASGKSRRMGQDKALLPFGPGTLIEHVAERCGAFRRPLLVSASAGRELPGRLQSATRAADRYEGAGPLAGLEALRRAASTPWLVVVPCDMPFLTEKDLDALVQLGRQGGAVDQVIYRAPRGRYSLPQALGPESGSALVAALERGDNRLLGWADEARIRRLELSSATPALETDVFDNLNDPASYENARARLFPSE